MTTIKTEATETVCESEHVEIHTVDDDDDMYCQFGGQYEAQDCYVWIDPGAREMGAEYNAEIGNAVPMPVWHHLMLRFSIPVLTADAANSLLEELEPLARRICDGFETEWDGSNWVGEYDNDAEAASAEIERICQETLGDYDSHVQVWEAAEWFSDGMRDAAKTFGVTASTTDDELAEICDTALTAAHGEGVHVLRRLEQYFDDVRQMLRDEADEDEDEDEG